MVNDEVFQVLVQTPKERQNSTLLKYSWAARTVFRI
jgi:hypothetical protein